MNQKENLQLQSELDPDEQLLWAGQPRQGFHFRMSDAVEIPVAVLWIIGVLMWTGLVIIKASEKEGKPGPLAGLFFTGIFVAAGLHLIYKRFIGDSKRRARTFYGVTNHRILIVSAQKKSVTTCISLKTLRDFTLTEHRRGWGSICFGHVEPHAPKFEMTANAKDVFNTIRTAQKEI